MFLQTLTIKSLQKKQGKRTKYAKSSFVCIKRRLTDVTSNGMVNTIKNEKHQAVNTDKVTIICCLGIFP